MAHETFLNGRVTMLLGDVRPMLRTLPPDHFDCVVTSPPYWGLRDYGVDGQLGLEPTLAEHISTMVDVFEDVRRVLKPSGSFWLNYGDCYATMVNGRSAEDTKATGNDDRTFRNKPFSTVQGTLKPGDLCMVPNRLAIALQDAGWWVKAENIWGKPNSMPDSSGVYRPATSHEKIFLLAKSDQCDLWRARDTGELSTCPDLTEQCALRGDPERDSHRWIRMPFWYSAKDVRQPAIYANSGRTSATKAQLDPDRKRNGKDGNAASFRAITQDRLLRNYEPSPGKQCGHSRRHAGFNDRWDAMEKREQQANGHLLRQHEPAPVNVWDIATEPFSEAHFATMPRFLVERCLRAGCPPNGKVLDPFGGSGTVGLVAAQLGHIPTLIELNPEYATLARARIESAFMGKDEGSRHMVKQTGNLAVDAGPLFTTNS